MSGYPPNFPRRVRNDEAIFKILAWLVVLYIAAVTLLAPWSFTDSIGSIAPTSHKGRPDGQPIASERLPVRHGPAPLVQDPGHPGGN